MNRNESKYFNTSKRMVDALIFLLKEEEFEFISIKEVCAKAGVNRSTFYLHYSNTRDLLEDAIRMLSESFASHFRAHESPRTIATKKDLADLYLIKDEYLLPYLAFVKENQRVFQAVKDHPDLFRAGESYQSLFVSLFEPIMARFGLAQEWHGYLMDFYIRGISSIVLRWAAEGCVVPAEEISDFIQALVLKHDGKTSDRH